MHKTSGNILCIFFEFSILSLTFDLNPFTETGSDTMALFQKIFSRKE